MDTQSDIPEFKRGIFNPDAVMEYEGKKRLLFSRRGFSQANVQKNYTSGSYSAWKQKRQKVNWS